MLERIKAASRLPGGGQIGTDQLAAVLSATPAALLCGLVNTGIVALDLSLSRNRENRPVISRLQSQMYLTIAQANNQPQMVMNRNDLHRDWGPSALNVNHQASLSGTYELPFGHGKHWLGNATGFQDKLVGGWQ